jgi:hypothetical protein
VCCKESFLAILGEEWKEKYKAIETTVNKEIAHADHSSHKGEHRLDDAGVVVLKLKEVVDDIDLAIFESAAFKEDDRYVFESYLKKIFREEDDVYFR